LIADDHEIERDGVRAVIEERPGWMICGEAATGRDAVALVAELSPDIAILDLAMPGMNGLQATRKIVRQSPLTRVIIFTMYESDVLVRDVLSAGARGYVLKSDPASHIVCAVDAVLHGTPFFSDRVTWTILEGYLRDIGRANIALPDALTSREREIAQLIAEGCNNVNVAALLDISLKTAEIHRRSIMRKLNLRSVAELVRYAIRNKIIEA
jgi:DNA-binding NarL/FixJ family response regulator